MKGFAILPLALLLAGCASGYKQFYRAYNGATPDHIAATRASPPPDVPLVDHISRIGPGAADPYMDQGYLPIGFSSFNGSSASDSQAIAQAKAVKADLVVIVDPSYTGSRSSVIPIVTPTSSTTYSTGTATAYGHGGAVTAYGSGQSTTYGSTTNYIPINTDRFDYGAVYFVKVKMLFGARTAPLNDDQRKLIQSNHGVVVLGVATSSPAFEADVLPGDIILAFNGEQISRPEDVGKAAQSNAGKSVSIDIYRAGERLIKIAKLP